MTCHRAHLVVTALLGACPRCAARSPRSATRAGAGATCSVTRCQSGPARDRPVVVVGAGVFQCASGHPHTADARLGDTPRCP